MPKKEKHNENWGGGREKKVPLRRTSWNVHYFPCMVY